jgi:hypothetical protein
MFSAKDPDHEIVRLIAFAPVLEDVHVAVVEAILPHPGMSRTWLVVRSFPREVIDKGLLRLGENHELDSCTG